MTNDEINIAVAELCVGWKKETRKMYAGSPNVKGWGFNTKLSRGHVDRHFVSYPIQFPNWWEDLNVAREAEATITDQEWPEYERHLRAVTLRDGVEGEGLYRRMIRATSQQRCEALLRLKGKWID